MSGKVRLLNGQFLVRGERGVIAECRDCALFTPNAEGCHGQCAHADATSVAWEKSCCEDWEPKS